MRVVTTVSTTTWVMPREHVEYATSLLVFIYVYDEYFSKLKCACNMHESH